MPPSTALQIITNAFYECGAFAQAEVLPAGDASFGLSKLNRLLDSWDADGLTVFARSFLGGFSGFTDTNTPQFILFPSVQPLSVGQAFVITSASLTSNVATYIAKNAFALGDLIDISNATPAAFNVVSAQVQSATATQFTLSIINANIASTPQPAQNPPVVGAFAVYTGNPQPTYPTFTQRPVKVESANIVLNNLNPFVKVPLHVRDADWWSANSVPTITSSIPTDLYYEPSFPNGNLFLWPMQIQNYGLELVVWTNLAGIPALTYPFYLPQGYEDAITYNLAESLIPSYQVPSSIAANVRELARMSRVKLHKLNSKSPTMVTRDVGIPDGSTNRPYFNWLSGMTTTR
jgi:hypothetical protein